MESEGGKWRVREGESEAGTEEERDEKGIEGGKK